MMILAVAWITLSAFADQNTKANTYHYGERTVQVVASANELTLSVDHLLKESRYAEISSRAYYRSYYREIDGGIPLEIQDWIRPLDAEESSKYSYEAPFTADSLKLTLRFEPGSDWQRLENLIGDGLEGILWILEQDLIEFFAQNSTQAAAFYQKGDDDYDDFYERFALLKIPSFTTTGEIKIGRQFAEAVKSGKVGRSTNPRFQAYEEMKPEEFRLKDHPLLVVHTDRTLDLYGLTRAPLEGLLQAFSSRNLPIIRMWNTGSEGFEDWTSLTQFPKNSKFVMAYGGEHPLEVLAPEVTVVGNWFFWCQGNALGHSAMRYFRTHPKQPFVAHMPTDTILIAPNSTDLGFAPTEEQTDARLSLAKAIELHGTSWFVNYLPTFRRNYLRWWWDPMNAKWKGELPQRLRIVVELDHQKIAQLDPETDFHEVNPSEIETLVLRLWHREKHPLLKK